MAERSLDFFLGAKASKTSFANVGLGYIAGNSLQRFGSFISDRTNSATFWFLVVIPANFCMHYSKVVSFLLLVNSR